MDHEIFGQSLWAEGIYQSNLFSRASYSYSRISMQFMRFSKIIRNWVESVLEDSLFLSLSLPRVAAAATMWWEAVFSDRIDRRVSREFLKVTRGFPFLRVS